MTQAFQFPSVYQEFIALSRYSRYQPSLGRRETWPETVARLIAFWKKKRPELDEALFSRLHDAVLNLRVMPSMRSLMTAGPAAERDEAALYNCTSAAITGTGPTVALWDESLKEMGYDDPINITLRTPIVFDELLYILLCGAGVGFSVERQFTNEMPTVGKTLSRSIYKRNNKNYPGVPKHELSSFEKKLNTIIVADSKYGWASALRILVVELYNGNFDVKYDVSLVRPAGAVLNTFGGRASGSGALVKMFEQVRTIFKQAAGRKLTSIECHDVMCHVASAVVVGGVRRSSLLSMSNLSDDRMRYAKSGEWWIDNPQRAMANNSVAYTEKPEIGAFMREWQALYDSKSGERGIINREAAKKACVRTGRDPNHNWLLNPCFAPGTMVQTKEGHFPIEDLVGKTVEVWDGAAWVEIDNFRVTAENQEVWKVTLHDGSEIVATPYHTFITDDGSRVQLQDLSVGERLAWSEAPETHGSIEEPGAYLKGFLVGDGSSYSGKRPLLWIYDTKYMCEDRLLASAEELPTGAGAANAKKNLETRPAGRNRKALIGLTDRVGPLPWCLEHKQGLPREVFAWSKKSKVEFLAGLFDADATASDAKNGFMYQLASISSQLLLDVQLLLKTIGVKSKLSCMHPARKLDFGPTRGGIYDTQACYRLTISQISSIKLAGQVTFSRLTSFVDKEVAYTPKSKHNKIVAIAPVGVAPKVYCCTVQTNNTFSLTAGLKVGNCAESLMRDTGQMCNLSSIVVRSTDTLEELMDKAEIAAIFGTIQATMTNFVYLSPRWRQNCEDERLIGVSLTGLTDHPVLQNASPEARSWLRQLSRHVHSTNEKYAKLLNINRAAAATLCKPEGTSSQLNDTASGLHTRFSPYYIRRVRADMKDPLATVMQQQGFPCEVDVTNQTNLVFSFPIKAPQKALFRDARTAIEQLEYWLMLKQDWCDSHNPSVTIYVKEHEWLDVGAWVYKNFDELCGISFLPHSDHIYQQAPYEECTKEQYEALLSTMPKSIDYAALEALETSDRTTGVQEGACSAGACELF